jgi:hypothetical protein
VKCHLCPWEPNPLSDRAERLFAYAEHVRAHHTSFFRTHILGPLRRSELT